MSSSLVIAEKRVRQRIVTVCRDMVEECNDPGETYRDCNDRPRTDHVVPRRWRSVGASVGRRGCGAKSLGLFYVRLRAARGVVVSAQDVIWINAVQGFEGSTFGHTTLSVAHS